VDCRPHPGRREDAESVGRQCTMKRVQQGAGAPTQDSRARADATNALGMAIDPRADAAGQILGRIIHGDHGTQAASWAFTDRARRAGPLPSRGSVGDPYHNVVAEAS
jgi:transposase InsO family protein